MFRSTFSFTAALLVLIPVVGYAQEEAQDTPHSDRTAAAARSGDPPASQPRAAASPVRPSPELLSLREGLAVAFDDVVTSPKAIPTPPAGSWGIVSEGTGGGGIFRDADSDAEAWLGADRTGVTGYGLIAGGYFQNSTGSGFVRLGFGDWGIAAAGNYTGAYIADADGSGYAWLGYDRPSGNDAGGTPNDGEYGVYAGGGRAGGYFEDNIAGSYAYVGFDGYGILAHGSFTGGLFQDTDDSAYGYVGSSGYGVSASGTVVGGHFSDRDTGDSGEAYVGYGDRGIEASGDVAGGYFEDSDSSGYAYIGYGDRGVTARGSFAGGYFGDTDGSGRAWLAYDRPSGTDKGGEPNDGEYGVYAGGGKAGAYFEETAGSGYAYVAAVDYGIVAAGDLSGGLFVDTDDGSTGFVGAGNIGVRGIGSEAGGTFSDDDGSGLAYVGYGDRGIEGYGNDAGGYFEDTDGSGVGYVGRGNLGIWAFGDNAGGYFEETDSSALARVAYDTYKISGTGAVSFVQNHPYDHSSVIVYAAPEGDEVATYTRGTARVIDGEAVVALGETFKWVTNPDIGLTAHLTPRGAPVPLAVVELSTEQMVVRGPDGGAGDLEFDYLVYGLRIGFEETSVVQEKEREAFIPSMSTHRELYKRRPDLHSYNSLERFKSMRQAVGKSDEVDLSRAHALRDAIVEFDPAVHQLPGPPEFEELAARSFGGRDEDDSVEAQISDASGSVRSRHERRPVSNYPAMASRIPVDDDGNVYATSFRPSAREVASLVEVSEAVEPGDVLVIDREDLGMMRRGFEAHDSGVIGVVAADAGVVLGADSSLSDGSADDLPHRAAVALGGVVGCKVDAGYGAIWPGDLLVTSPTPGHAMRTDAPLPGTMLGKALEPLAVGTGTIRVLVMLR